MKSASRPPLRIAAAIFKPRARVSIPAMWAWKRSGGGVGIPLVLGGLVWLAFDVKRTGRVNGLVVVKGNVPEFVQVFHLALEVRIQQGRLSFAAAAKHITFTAHFVCNLYRLFHLR